MKQTAIEWLLTKIPFDVSLELIKNGITKEAKEMEKQQQGYSEEEIIDLLQKALTHQDDGETGSLVTAQGEIRPANFFSWFERVKKK